MAKIKLESSDGETLEVDWRVAARLMRIEGFHGGDCAIGKVFPVPEVRGEILALVITFCEKKARFDDDLNRYPRHLVERSRQHWNTEFLNIRLGVLFDLILASRFLQVEELLDRACQAVADSISGKSVGEIRALFNIRERLTSRCHS